MSELRVGIDLSFDKIPRFVCFRVSPCVRETKKSPFDWLLLRATPCYLVVVGGGSISKQRDTAVNQPDT